MARLVNRTTTLLVVSETRAHIQLSEFGIWCVRNYFREKGEEKSI